MKRLTEKLNGKNVIPLRHSCKTKWSICSIGLGGTCEEYLFGDHADRLAAIEDILGEEYELDRLRELVEADREGRCVVLPCKIGAPVWKLHDECDFPGDCYTKRKCMGCEYRSLFIDKQMFFLSMLNQNGELNPSYYKTRSEAEAALKEREQE